MPDLRSVVIADPNPENRRFIMTLLERPDLQFREAGTSAELQVAVSDLKAVLIIVALDLPDQDGFQAVNQLFSSASSKHLSVLMLGPHMADRRMRLHAALNEVLDYLPRPLDAELFCHRANDLLRVVSNAAVIQSMHFTEQRLNDTMTEGLLGVGEDGRIVYANQTALRALGVSAGRLVNVPLLSLLEEPVTRVDANWREHALAVAIQSKSIVQVPRTRLWKADGASIPVSCAAIPLHEQGNMVLLLAFRLLANEGDARDKLARLASLDVLTGLPLRMRFEEALNGAVSIAERDGLTFSIFVIDMDHFSYINEILGYPMGDALLRAIVDRIRLSSCRGLLARLSGDKFALLADQVQDERGAARIAHQLRALFRAPFLLDGHEIFCTASIGVALYPSCGKSSSALLVSAEAAVTKAKQMGRNEVQFYTARMNRQSIQRLLLENELHRAIVGRDLSARICALSVSSSNAPLREIIPVWRSERGVTEGAELWALAKETGLALELSEWLLEMACQEIEISRQEGGAPLIVSLGVSHLLNQFFLLKFKGLCALYGLSGGEAVFAIEAHPALLEDGLGMQRLAFLRERQFMLMLESDDIGNAFLPNLSAAPWEYASLCPPNKTEERSQWVFRYVIDLLHTLNIKVILRRAEDTTFRGLCDYWTSS